MSSAKPTSNSCWSAAGPSQGSQTFDLDGHQIPYIGKSALIRNKKAAGRHKDLADVEELGRLET